MDKRYQVFVSSTYTDLIEERQVVFQTLMEMDCIPAGMELFPAADEDQFEFIKKVIDDCDYYLLIIGGRYGTLAADHISYAEKEFDYAVEQGKKVVVLVHKDPDLIPSGKSETQPELREKLDAFKLKAMTGRLVDFWEEPKDLRGMVAVSLNKTIKMFPAIGWVRANKVANEDLFQELSELRSKNDTLSSQLIEQKSQIWDNMHDLIDFDSCFVIKYTTAIFEEENKILLVNRTWRQIFRVIAPTAMQFGLLKSAKIDLIADVMADSKNAWLGFNKILNWDVIVAQMQGYGLVSVEQVTNREGYTSTKIKLTKKGMKEYTQSLLVFKPSADG